MSGEDSPEHDGQGDAARTVRTPPSNIPGPARTWNLNGQQNLVYKDVSGEHSPDPKGSTGGQEPETSVRRLIFRCRCGTRKSGPPTS